MDIDYLWKKGKKEDWEKALTKYCTNDKDEYMNDISKNPNIIRNMNGEEFYKFLYDHYFVWKYTQKNRLARNKSLLEKSYQSSEGFDCLERIKNNFFKIHDIMPMNTRLNVFMITEISGLGIAGASGLLSILYPEEYGTLDFFLVQELKKVSTIKNLEDIKKINGSSLRIKDAVFLEDIIRNKAEKLNDLFGTQMWNPRKIDMVLWANHCKQKS